jgi:hypothetical protein
VDYFQKSTQSSGATPNEWSSPKDKMLTSKAYGKTKARLTSEKAQVEDKSDFREDLKWRPSSGLSAKIHSKLGGYTHWVRGQTQNTDSSASLKTSPPGRKRVWAEMILFGELQGRVSPEDSNKKFVEIIDIPGML